MAGRADRNTRITNQAKAGISNFKVDPNNILGRDQKSGRNKLYAQAILKPADYLIQRESAMETVIDALNNDMYTHFWNFLTLGMDKDKAQILFLPDGNKFMPGLPESTVSKFCLKVAETMEEITEEAFEMVMPINHKDLAIRKLHFDKEEE